MVPLAWALRNAGHDVLAAVPASLVAAAVGAGLPAISIGDVLIQSAHDDPAPAHQSQTTEALVEHVLEFYVPLAEASVDKVLETALAWRADLIVHPSWDYAAPLAAAALGIPSILHSWGLLPPPEIDLAAFDALAGLRGKLGGDPVGDPRWIDVCPPGLAVQSPPGALPMRYVAYNGSVELQPWLLREPERPRICVTLGNIPILGEHNDVVSTVIEALAGTEVELVVAAADRLSVGTDLPGNVRVERRLPLRQLLPTCALAIHHGGAGSTMASIVTGLPQLVLPQMCVQYQHAQQIAAVGAGEWLAPAQVGVDSVRSAVRRLLGDPAPAQVSRSLRDELAERPGVAAVAATVAALLPAASPVTV
ncbi:nucleotide disphospho-sugar-binding domain-containing protein [Actinoplanes sp. L3-i22]|uniref:nucleotide disphospho-sugar-binding domain-containing protein n=1 Tax=Actinoplanes sp. L3-i22 TaxID=2836373 RepID=UPI001C75D53B|nr:nucleotide disphospho-sugar-binding domain-containing protein [Actinoplanes sp. L3-i22]BCY08839.1 glycosyl transferase [Actinoplanes sp. L3-i22]